MIKTLGHKALRIFRISFSFSLAQWMVGVLVCLYLTLNYEERTKSLKYKVKKQYRLIAS